MRTLAAFASLGMLVVSVAASCAGDERVKRLSDGGSAGDGAGGTPAVGKGGGSSDPEGGAGGVPAAGGAGAATGGAGLGGAPDVDSSGGTGAPSPLEEGGGGSGGSPGLECPVGAPGTFNHACADSVATWAPVWNGTLDRFELQLGDLPFPVASGTISFFYSFADGQQCGTVPIVVGPTGITAPVVTQFIPTAVRITTFTFQDVCGNTHQYDPAGAPACNDIRGSGTGFGNITLACNARLNGTCPEACLLE